MWPETKSAKRANVSPRRWKAARSFTAESATKRSRRPGPWTRRCMNILTRRWASLSVWACSLAFLSRAAALVATGNNGNMEQPTVNLADLAATSRRFAGRLITTGENRLELLMVEVQEERERLLHAILLALGVALFAFLSGVALTITLVVLLWSASPVGVLLTLTVLYGAVALLLYRRFALLQREWKSFPATIDQLKKDRACFEKILS